MKISISCGGRFHGFDMATYFQKKDVLHQLVTGYPKFQVLKHGIRKEYVLSIYLNEIINRLTNKLGLGYPLNTFSCHVYDYLTSFLIKKNSHAYFLWSGYSLRTIRVLKKNNPKAIIILVRGSSHILEQEKLLKQINGNKQPVIDNKMIARELAEYELADYINVPSTFALNTFIKYGFDEKKLFLNLLGVNLSQFPFKSKIESDVLTFGYVGVLSKQKNVEAIIDQVEKAYQINPKVKLVLVGAIDEKSFSKEKINKPFIDYKGKYAQSELFRVYQDIDVFILNSVQDGFGMVLLQAMSSGCAIIATENSGGPDIIDNYLNGITIPPFNDDALLDAINWFVQHKAKIPEMGMKNRTLSEKGFSWDDFGLRNIDFVSKAITQ